ncbi:MAG: hypothetical protein AB1806_17650 [Acidobacteriota bacterium]
MASAGERAPTSGQGGTSLFAGGCRPFDCRVDVPGWRIYVAQLAFNEGRDLGNVMEVAVEGSLDWLARRRPDGSSDAADTMHLIRGALGPLGIDLARVRPSSELLCDRLATAPATARGGLAWQFLCVLVARSAAPWSVLDRKALSPPLVLRIGEDQESLPHDGGRMRCGDLPVLADQAAVRASPWTLESAERLDACTEPVFVCYLPGDLMRRVDPKNHLGRLVWLTWAFTFAFARTYSCQADQL